MRDEAEELALDLVQAREPPIRLIQHGGLTPCHGVRFLELRPHQLLVDRDGRRVGDVSQRLDLGLGPGRGPLPGLWRPK